MERQQIQKLKEVLLEERRRLIDELNRIAEKGGNKVKVRFPDYGKTNDENAQEVSDFERLTALGYELENRINQIDRVLNRIEKGTYGRCQTCSNKIEEQRLKVMPEATLCSSCAKINRKIKGG